MIEAPAANQHLCNVKIMKTLYLLRHAKSSWDDPGLADFDRALSGRGKRACRTLAEAIVSFGVEPELILCSSARRTQETFERIAPAFAKKYTLSVERQLYLASARKLLERLRRVPDGTHSAMLIGHNPGLQRLAQMVAGGGERSALDRLVAKFPTAALAEFNFSGTEWGTLDAGIAELVRLWSPRDGEKGDA
jgi:phosphohistidine phosphatase